MSALPALAQADAAKPPADAPKMSDTKSMTAKGEGLGRAADSLPWPASPAVFAVDSSTKIQARAPRTRPRDEG